MVPPIWAVWVLLLWWAAYCGQPGQCGWPCPFRFQALPCEEASSHWWVGPGREETAEPHGVLGLVPSGWWAKPGTRVSGYRALGVPELVSV